MLEQSNLVGQGTYGAKVRNRVAQLSILALADSALTDDYITGSTNPTLLARKRADGTAPKGLLSGMVVAATTDGAAAASATATSLVGIALNDAIGNAFESSSGFASGKAVYLCGAGSVVTVDIYEVEDSAAAALTYVVGDKVYASANGLITKEADGDVLGVVLDVDAKGLTIQLRI